MRWKVSSSSRPAHLRHGDRMGRQPKSYSQADRLMQMIRTLASRAVTVNEVAESFAITRRQVYRDLSRIQEDGHPLTPPAYGERNDC